MKRIGQFGLLLSLVVIITCKEKAPKPADEEMHILVDPVDPTFVPDDTLQMHIMETNEGKTKKPKNHEDKQKDLENKQQELVKKHKHHGKHRKRVPHNRKNRTHKHVQADPVRPNTAYSPLDFEVNLAPLTGGQKMMVTLPMVQKMLDDYSTGIDIKHAYEVINANGDNCTIVDLVPLALGEKAAVIEVAMAPKLAELRDNFIESMDKAFVALPTLFKSYSDVVFNTNQTLFELSREISDIYRTDPQTSNLLIAISAVNFVQTNQDIILPAVGYIQYYISTHQQDA